MRYTDEQAEIVLKYIAGNQDPNDPASLRLRKMWMMFLTTRVRMLAGIVRNMVGDAVVAGPFKGMRMTAEASAHYPCHLLGTYEHELQPAFEKVIAGPYTRILNIGCSFGYYAVGLARRMPHITIDAFDIDPDARRKCADMAALNGVQDRVRIAGEFRGEDFAAYASEKTLAIVDIEGAETALLDPARYPALGKIDLIVELHDLMRPDISQTIAARFAPTHMIEFVNNRTILPNLETLLPPGQTLDPFDHLLLGWEGRDGPTPWGVFTVNAA